MSAQSLPDPSSTPPPDLPVVVETVNLGKTYRTGFWLNQKIQSLTDCSLAIYQGETFGLLGPNGAGKTTLLKILLGILRPSQGRGRLLGQPLGERSVKRRIGYLPENPYFYDFLTGWEFLDYTASLFDIPTKRRHQRLRDLLDLVGLGVDTAQKKQLRQYSKGMLQRIGMAQALVNDPDVVFLDEPMSGLDPTGRFQVREIILSLKAQGKTIFFNSHILSDVEVICDRIAILNRGQLICIGNLNQLLGSANHYLVKGQGGQPDQLTAWLVDLEFQGQNWRGIVSDDPYGFMAHLKTTEARLLSMQQGRPSLEEFFIQQIRQSQP